MASLDSISIAIERRPCYVDGRKAMFHQWVQDAPRLSSVGSLVSTLGIVEYEDGTVELVEPQAIKFADGGGFKETAFRE